MTVKQLESAALAAHARGDRWADFWTRHADAIRQAEPYNAGRYRKLVNRLLSLVTSDDNDGMEPIDAEPWIADDSHKPADVGTRARCLIPLLTIPRRDDGRPPTPPPIKGTW